MPFQFPAIETTDPEATNSTRIPPDMVEDFFKGVQEQMKCFESTSARMKPWVASACSGRSPYGDSDHDSDSLYFGRALS